MSGIIPGVMNGDHIGGHTAKHRACPERFSSGGFPEFKNFLRRGSPRSDVVLVQLFAFEHLREISVSQNNKDTYCDQVRINVFEIYFFHAVGLLMLQK